MNIENIHVGQHLLILDDSWGLNEIHCTGLPWRVIAISVPFVMVKFNNTVTNFDTRRFTFSKPSDNYVEQYNEVMKSGSIISASPGNVVIQTHSKIETEKECIEHKHPCPRCKSPMVERCLDPSEGFLLVCDECNLTQEVL